MKRKFFAAFLALAFSAMLFTGCDYDYRDEDWVGYTYLYAMGLMSNPSGMKNIDKAHREAFDSAFNDIEIFGARLCVPMKVSELPDKFELSDSYDGYVPLSEKKPSETELNGGLKRYRLYLYYDREIRTADIFVICKGDQSIEDGIIYEMEFGLLNRQPALLGGQVDINSDINEVKAFLGEGNEFYDTLEFSNSEFCTLFYTDGNRLIELTYSVQGDDISLLTGYIRTYNNH